MLKFLVLLVPVFLLSCTSAFETAREADTIEAWERFLARDKAGGVHHFQAQARLDELLWGEAVTEGSPAAWDRYISHRELRPPSRLAEAIEQRASLAFEVAAKESNIDSWDGFLSENDRAKPSWAHRARSRRSALLYGGEVALDCKTVDHTVEGPAATFENNGGLTVSRALLSLSAQSEHSDQLRSVKRWTGGSLSRSPILPGETAEVRVGDGTGETAFSACRIVELEFAESAEVEDRYFASRSGAAVQTSRESGGSFQADEAMRTPEEELIDGLTSAQRKCMSECAARYHCILTCTEATANVVGNASDIAVQLASRCWDENCIPNYACSSACESVMDDLLLSFFAGDAD